jgi:hypothetical protein
VGKMLQLVFFLSFSVEFKQKRGKQICQFFRRQLVKHYKKMGTPNELFKKTEKITLLMQ